jgi:hypothetical protein
MTNVDLCKEFEEVKQQIEKIIDEAIKKLFEVRDRLAKIIVIDARLIEGEADKYGALVTYLDLMNLIQALTSGDTTISVDIDRVLDNLGCRKEEKKEGGK